MREDGLLTEDNKVINKYNILNFYPDVNKYTRALLILRDYGYSFKNVEETSKVLGVSSKTLCPYYKKLMGSVKREAYDGPAVYQITTLDDKIIYIGYTTNFALRRKQHLSFILNKSSKAQLYKYCDQYNISEVKITTVIEHTDLNMLRQLEAYLIGTLRPVGNEMVSR